MVMLLALAMTGLCYAAIFLVESPQIVSRPAAQLIIKVFCALGLGSLISLVAFLGFGAACRGKLNHRREGCRDLVGKFWESRFGAGSDLNQETKVSREDKAGNEHEGYLS